MSIYQSSDQERFSVEIMANLGEFGNKYRKIKGLKVSLFNIKTGIYSKNMNMQKKELNLKK